MARAVRLMAGGLAVGSAGWRLVRWCVSKLGVCKAEAGYGVREISEV